MRPNKKKSPFTFPVVERMTFSDLPHINMSYDAELHQGHLKMKASSQGFPTERRLLTGKWISLTTWEKEKQNCLPRIKDNPIQ